MLKTHQEKKMREYSTQPFEYDEIEVIIFDFDETLYYCPNAQTLYTDYLTRAILDLSYSTTIKKHVAEELTRRGYLGDKAERPSFSEHCEEYFSIYQPEWEAYKKKHFFEPDYSLSTIVDNGVLHKLSQKHVLILVSNEIIDNIAYKAQKLGIDLSVFARIYAPTRDHPTGEPKDEIYRRIINTYLLDGTQIYSVGDRYHIDIEPLLRRGGAGLLVDNTADTTKFLAEKFLSEKL